MERNYDIATLCIRDDDTIYRCFTHATVSANVAEDQNLQQVQCLPCLSFEQTASSFYLPSFDALSTIDFFLVGLVAYSTTTQLSPIKPEPRKLFGNHPPKTPNFCTTWLTLLLLTAPKPVGTHTNSSNNSITMDSTSWTTSTQSAPLPCPHGVQNLLHLLSKRHFVVKIDLCAPVEFRRPTRWRHESAKK